MHDFGPRLWLFYSPFLLPPKKDWRRKGEWISSNQNHAFMLYLRNYVNQFWHEIIINRYAFTVKKLKLSCEGTFSLWIQSLRDIMAIRQNIHYLSWKKNWLVLCKQRKEHFSIIRSAIFYEQMCLNLFFDIDLISLIVIGFKFNFTILNISRIEMEIHITGNIKI